MELKNKIKLKKFFAMFLLVIQIISGSSTEAFAFTLPDLSNDYGEVILDYNSIYDDSSKDKDNDKNSNKDNDNDSSTNNENSNNSDSREQNEPVETPKAETEKNPEVEKTNNTSNNNSNNQETPPLATTKAPSTAAIKNENKSIFIQRNTVVEPLTNIVGKPIEVYGDADIPALDDRVQCWADVDPNPRGHWVVDYAALLHGEEDNVSVAYCITPYQKGIEPNVPVTVVPADYSTYDELDKKLLGIMMAGYPMDYHGASAGDAYFATYIAIRHLQHQYPDKWNNSLGFHFTSDDWPSHWKGDQNIINLAKTIYEQGINNPYQHQANTSLDIKYSSTLQEMTESGNNLTITVTPNGNYDYGKILFNDSYIKDAINNGKATATINGSNVNFELGILGSDDQTEGIKINKGESLVITIDKTFAQNGMQSGDTKEALFQFITRDKNNLQSFIARNTDSSRQDYGILIAEPVAVDGKFIWKKDGDTPEEPTPTPTPTTDPDPDPELGKLKITKFNKKTKDLAKDAIFAIEGKSLSVYDFYVEIKATNGAPIPLPGGGYATVQDGIIELHDIKQGTYEVTEISPPPYFDYCDLGQNSKTVIVDTAASIFPQVAFENNPFATLKIRKVDEVTGEPVPGAILKIRNPLYDFDVELVTDSNGIIEIPNLPQGNYEITEVYAPLGYVLSKERVTATLQWGETTDITFKNIPKTSLKIYKVDAETGEPLAGAKFTLKEPSTGASYEVTTGEDGTAVIMDLPEGTYNLVEILAPEGYILAECPKTIVIENNRVNEIVVKNQKKSEIHVKKTDIDGNPLEGVSFHIYKFGEHTPIENSPITTDANGIAKIDNIPPGSYEVQEVQALPGYALDTTRYPIEVKEGVSDPFVVTVINKKLPDLTIIKLDSQTCEPILCPCTEFTIEKLDEPGKGMITGNPFTTDKTGQIHIPDLLPGVYQITEIKPPNGYDLPDKNVQEITLKYDEDFVLQVFNTRLPDLTIIKRDKDTQEVLQGGVFEVEKIGEGPGEGLIENNPFTTDENGKIVIPDIAKGSYKITEITPPPGYNLSEPNYQIIDMIPGIDNTVTFENRRMPGLTIHKVDAITGENLEGALFEIEKLENPDKGLLTGNPFKTDDKGIINLEKLPSGKYKITEIKAPNGYYLNPENQSKIIEIKDNEDYYLRWENTKLPTLVINKIDALTGRGIPNTYYKIWYAVNGDQYGNYRLIGEYKTDKNGQIVLPNMPVGWYKYEETRPAQGYHLGSERVFYVFLSAGDNAYAEIQKPENPPAKNPAKPGDINVSSGNDYKFKSWPVVGASVGASVLSESSVGPQLLKTTGLSDSSRVISKIEFSDSPETNIASTLLASTLLNISSPERSITNLTSTVPDVEAMVGIMPLDYINYPLNSIVIKKVDAITGQLLPGAIFELYKVTGEISGTNGTAIGRYTTDASGIVIITGLDPGGYIVKEVKAPHNYDIDETSQQQAWLKQDGTSIVELTFANYPYGDLVINKMDSVTKEALQGARFQVTDSHGAYVGSTANGMHTTDAAGTIKIDHLKPGAYVIREIQAPDGYLLDTNVQTIHIGYGEIKSCEFYNQPLGGLTIKKYDSVTKEPLADAIFKVTDIKGGVVGTSDGTYRTDSSGTIFISGLPKGGYKVQEIQAPDGYLLDNFAQTIEILDNRMYSLDFYNEPLVSLVIVKYDSVTKLPLSGAKFKVTKAGNGEIIGNYTTDATGRILLNELKPGIYEVAETAAPDGYIADTASQTVELKKNTTKQLDFYNSPKDAFLIQKLDGVSKEPLAGAIIKVTTVDDKFIGEYRTDSSGTISIKNLTPGTYKVQEIQAPTDYVLDDTVKLVYLEKGKPILVELYNYKEAGITILKRDEKTKACLEGAMFEVRKVNGELIGSNYISDKNGRVNINNLAPGWYTVKEVKAPNGYAFNCQGVQNVEVKTDKLAEVVFENAKLGTIRIIKKDGITKKVLEGVQFRILNEKGEKLGNQEGIFITDTAGKIELVNQVPPGIYTIEEIKAKDGYTVDKTVRKIEIKYGGEEYIEWLNYPNAGILIKKYDEKTQKPISGVEFEILDSKKKSVGKYETDSSGEIYLDEKFPQGDYFVKETKPKTGYLPNDGTKNVTMKWNELTELKFYNTPIMGKVQIIKVAENNNEITGQLAEDYLKGAEFTIYDSSGNAVEKLITDAAGKATSNWIPYGKYTLKETKAPSYFIPLEETFEFEIKTHEKTVVLELTNKSVSLKTNVEKSSVKEALAGDTIKYEFFNIQNKSLVPLNDFYLHESVPYGSMSVTRLFTGQYNQNLNYKIVYKTNKNSEYKVLKDNLFTDRVYEIDLSKHLMSGEVVTDIRFDFGKVGVGFREVERPFIYAKLNENLQSGHKITNIATVGGQYDMQTVKAEDKFETIIIGNGTYKQVTQGKLPKTGR